MAIAPFWFSTDHLWSAIVPFWLSADKVIGVLQHGGEWVKSCNAAIKDPWSMQLVTLPFPNLMICYSWNKMSTKSKQLISFRRPLFQRVLQMSTRANLKLMTGIQTDKPVNKANLLDRARMRVRSLVWSEWRASKDTNLDSALTLPRLRSHACVSVFILLFITMATLHLLPWWSADLLILIFPLPCGPLTTNCFNRGRISHAVCF